MRSVILTIYNDPEAYPPTLNTAYILSEKYDKVILVGRGLMHSHITFPENVDYIRLNPEISFSDLSGISAIKKIDFFISYIKVLRKLHKQFIPEMIICHDVLAAFAYWILSFFISRKKKSIFWYHSHDVIHKNSMPRFSVLWLGSKFEKLFFRRIDVFSLPVEERKQYFPLNEFKGKVCVIPNYPRLAALDKYSIIKGPPKKGGVIQLIYQGMLGDNHGFENFISILDRDISGFQLSLTLIGKVNESYKEILIQKAEALAVRDKLRILPSLPYMELIKQTANYHIGLATHLPGKRAIYRYGATSSNKIYEYAALGLPVILYDTPHYRKYLEKYSWTEFVDLSSESIVNSIQSLIDNYKFNRQKAINDFRDHLNYEKVFQESWEKINYGA